MIRTVETEARFISDRLKLPYDHLLVTVEDDVTKHPYKVVYESLPSGAFMEVKILKASNGAEQFGLHLNVAHPWIQMACFGPEVTPEIRARIEVMLFALAGVQARTAEERKFYDSEMHEWDQKLTAAMRVLRTIPGYTFEEMAVAEQED